MVNFLDFITTYHSSLSVFITNSMHSGNKKHHEILNQKFTKQSNIFFVSFLFFFRQLVQNYVTLSRWFSHKTASLYTDKCTTATLFHNIEVSQGTSVWSLKNCMASFEMPFSSFVHICTNHLAKNNVITAQDCLIRNMIGVHDCFMLSSLLCLPGFY